MDERLERNLAAVEAKARAISPREGQCVVLAVDGMAASGKSTLAQRLCERLDGAIVHMDDFFLPQGFRTPDRLREPGGNVYYERFAREVLPYLRADEPFAYRVFDAHAHRYTGMRTVAAKPFRIVEGSYAQYPAFGDVYDVRIFCKTAPERQLERVRERDAEKAEMFRAMWIPMENRYFAAFEIEAYSDVVCES